MVIISKTIIDVTYYKIEVKTYFSADFINSRLTVLLRDGFKKKKMLMEFSIKLAGRVLDALVFH